MALKENWNDLVQNESDLNADDINKIAHSVIKNEEDISKATEDIKQANKELEKKADKDIVFKTVDLTKVTTVTEGEPTITETEIKPVFYMGDWAKGVINVTGYCEIEVKNTGIDYVFLYINGEEYFARRYGDGDETSLSFKGVVTEPIRFEVEPAANAKFTKFITTTDYELYNKVGDIDTALKAIITEQESIIALQNSLIGGDKA
jgi:hypothetical protein